MKTFLKSTVWRFFMRCLVTKLVYKSLYFSNAFMRELIILGPIFRRSALPKDKKASPEVNGSPESLRRPENTRLGSSIKPRSRRNQNSGLLKCNVDCPYS